MRDAKLLGDLAQIACRRVLVLHHTRAADHFQIGDLGKIRQDFVLHSPGEIGVLFVVAQIFEGQYRDAFFRNRSRATW